MKFTNFKINGESHAAVMDNGRWLDVSSLASMEEIVSGKKIDISEKLPEISGAEYANLFSKPVKLVCVGLNYRAHAENVNLKTSDVPILFSKFFNALVPSGAAVELPSWEDSYDYEAELVIVMGKTAWNVSEEDAADYIFGYTAGNDFSVRRPQMASSQWLIGKTMPGFGPCGPCIVSADEFGSPDSGKQIKSFVNGELRQNGSTADMIHSCSEIVSYASKFIRLEPGDLIFTGTPSGVNLEKKEKIWLKAGDLVEVEIEGIGTLSNRMV